LHLTRYKYGPALGELKLNERRMLDHAKPKIVSNLVSVLGRNIMLPAGFPRGKSVLIPVDPVRNPVRCSARTASLSLRGSATLAALQTHQQTHQQPQAPPEHPRSSLAALKAKEAKKRQLSKLKISQKKRKLSLTS